MQEYLAETCGLAKMMFNSHQPDLVVLDLGYPDAGSIKKSQVNMANIRKKLGMKPGEDSYIVNELGVGYRLKERTEK